MEDNRLNVGERLRARGAPCSFIFLSNRKKKKENTDSYVRSRPRRSQVASTGVKVLFDVCLSVRRRNIYALKSTDQRFHPGFAETVIHCSKITI